ncbi:MAG: CBS domain-containing protein [Methanomassiliicoccales archaeon]|nr:MAG: CBS domain-containing protein [Methanomassiliicoccales archaeon]
MSEVDIKDLRVGEVHESMIGKPALVNEDAQLKDAVEALTHNMISRKVYVVDGAGKLKGVITIETLLRQVGYRVGVRETGMISFFKFLSGIFKENVAEFMDKPVTVTDRHKILDALRMMVEHHLNDLPIIDDEDRIVGELHSLEILNHTKNIFNE